MEHKKLNVSETSNIIPSLIDSSNVFKVESNGGIKILKKKLFNIETLKAIDSLGGNVLKQAYTAAHLSNKMFNNTFRTLVIGTMALIPYGGIFISSQVGLLWPEEVDTHKNQINKKMDQLATRMDENISDYELDGFAKEVEALMKTLRRFEDVMNGKLHVSDKDNMQESNRIAIKCINDSFIKIINHLQKGVQQAGKLPIFTIIAAAHLQFLYFVERNGQSSKIQFSTDSFNQRLMNDFKKTTEEYIKYIQKTYQIGRQKFDKKMQDIAECEVGNYSCDDQENLREMRKHFEQIFVHQATASSLTAKKKVINLALAINEFENLMFEKKIYYNETWGNRTFFQVVKSKT